MARPVAIAAALAIAFGAPPVVPSARADEAKDRALAAEGERVVIMGRYVVSADRIDKKPRRYASVPGFEVPSRAPDEKTNWWLEALRRGQQLEDQVSPNEWLPPSPVPNTVIIDDTDLGASPPGRILTAPIRFESPADDLTWGRLAGARTSGTTILRRTTRTPTPSTRTYSARTPAMRRA